jgi:hypothetical protein
MRAKTRATIEDLYKAEGKAELVNGEIVKCRHWNARIRGEIFASCEIIPAHRPRQGTRGIPHVFHRSLRSDAISCRTTVYPFLEGAPILPSGP